MYWYFSQPHFVDEESDVQEELLIRKNPSILVYKGIICNNLGWSYMQLYDMVIEKLVCSISLYKGI